MKFILALLLIGAFITSSQSNAQSFGSSGESRAKAASADANEWKLIPTVGLTVFSATGSKLNKNGLSTTTGLVAGALADFSTVYPIVDIESGLLFMQEGDTVNNTGFKRTSDYLAVPLLVQVRPFLGFKAFSLDGGVIPALLIAAETHSGGTVKDAYSRMTPYDIQATAGVGLTYPISERMQMTAKLSAMRGLVAFERSGTAIYNQGFTFTGGLIF